MSKVLIDLLTAAKLTEHSLSIVLEELDELREQQREDHDRITRLEAAVEHLEETALEERRSGIERRGHNLNATATILSGIIGAVAGIASLIWQALHAH